MLRSVVRRLFSGGVSAQRTALYDEHLRCNGQMAEFAGWALPLKYSESHIVSHRHTREAASVFDVSHMLQIIITGKDRVAFMERATVADVEGLQHGKTVYSLMPTERGGIVDDCMYTKYTDHIYLVVNAGCAEKDWAHLNTLAKGFDVLLRKFDQSLIALQGPKAHEVLQRAVTDKTNLNKEMDFMSGRSMSVMGNTCVVTRCGYTGEDGFEISVPNTAAPEMWRRLIEENKGVVLPAGLAARDSLRLEAGLCLYGHDIDENTTPGEASLTWTIGKRRLATGGFLGADVVLGQIKAKKYDKKRVGIAFLSKKGVAREGSVVVHPTTGEEIGKFTSGTWSPILERSVGMAYVKAEHAKVNTPVHVRVRDSVYEATVASLPFVPARYYHIPQAK